MMDWRPDVAVNVENIWTMTTRHQLQKVRAANDRRDEAQIAREEV
jgi:hypothetical protein